MKRLALLAALALVGCGNDEAKPAGVDSGDEWTTVTDPLTGESFRCFTIYREGGYDGGPAMFCRAVDL